MERSLYKVKYTLIRDGKIHSNTTCHVYLPWASIEQSIINEELNYSSDVRIKIRKVKWVASTLIINK